MRNVSGASSSVGEVIVAQPSPKRQVVGLLACQRRWQRMSESVIQWPRIRRGGWAERPPLTVWSAWRTGSNCRAAPSRRATPDGLAAERDDESCNDCEDRNFRHDPTPRRWKLSQPLTSPVDCILIDDARISVNRPSRDSRIRVVPAGSWRNPGSLPECQRPGCGTSVRRGDGHRRLNAGRTLAIDR